MALSQHRQHRPPPAAHAKLALEPQPAALHLSLEQHPVHLGRLVRSNAPGTAASTGARQVGAMHHFPRAAQHLNLCGGSGSTPPACCNEAAKQAQACPAQ